MEITSVDQLQSIWKGFRSSIKSQIDPRALDDADALLAARSIVAQSIEIARQQKLIGNALEAHVDPLACRESIESIN